MFDSVFASFRWLLPLGGKFFRVAPGPTLFVILATLASQVSMLLASLLPLKVLILVGSEGVPSYLSQDFIPLNRDALILALCIATPAFYFLHLALEKLVLRASNLGAVRLLAQSRKIVLFENQEELAASSYRRYAGGLANAVFIACVWLALAFFFPPLCLLLVGYTAASIVCIGLAHKNSKALRERIDENLTSLVRVLTALGFMLAFLVLVLQFLSGAAEGFLLAIISLLLTRQAFNQTNQLASVIVNLYRNRRKLNALFFSYHTLSQVNDKQTEFWSLFAQSTRESWLRPLLLEHLALTSKQLDIHWHQTGMHDLVALEVSALNSEGELLGRYLLRFYGKSPSFIASHEATLLFDESSEHLPALPLLAAGQVGRWPCHIYSMPEGCAFTAPAKHIVSCLTALMAFEPPEDLAARYARSHPMLWQRLDTFLIERLTMLAGDDNWSQVRNLEEHLPSMLASIQGLPLVVVNPDISGNTLMQGPEGKLWITHWARWTLEPLGSGWPLDKESLTSLPRELQRASERRPALQSVDAQAVKLAALLFKFDELCTRQLYLDALALIPFLLESAPPFSQPNYPDGGFG